MTDSQVIAIKLHRCNSNEITSCSECVALQDPYCAWDKIAGKCRSHGAPRWLEENYFYQNVATGQHAACPSGKMSTKDANAVEQKGYRNDMDRMDAHHRGGGGHGGGLHLGGIGGGEVINIMQDKNYDGSGGPQISADVITAQYTVETLVMAVLAGAIFALLVGFITGYFCGRRCHKDEDDNLPYPDTEYEYFEQRQNINRIQAEPKLLPQVEEVTYAEPVLLPQTSSQNKMLHSPKNTLRKPPPPLTSQIPSQMGGGHHGVVMMGGGGGGVVMGGGPGGPMVGQMAGGGGGGGGPNSETLFQFQPDGYNTRDTYRGRDNFGTLRSHQVSFDFRTRTVNLSCIEWVYLVYVVPGNNQILYLQFLASASNDQNIRIFEKMHFFRYEYL